MFSFASKTENSKIPKWYVIALLLTLSLRFILIGISIHNDISPSIPQDPLQYKILATNLYQHGRFTLDATDPENFDLLRTPGYPLFLIPFLIVDHSGYSVVFFQQILSLLTAYIIFLILFRLTKRKNISALLSLIFFLWPYDILWSRMTMSESLFTFLLIAAVYVLLTRNDRKSDIIAGLLTGGMLLTRPQGILFLGVLFVFVLITGPKRRMWLYPAIVLLCVLPWLYRNYALTHSVTLSSSGTLNMIFGGVAGEDAKTQLEQLDAEKSKMVKDTLGKDSTLDWWSYTTKGLAPMNKILSDAHVSLSSIISKNTVCSARVWSIDQLRLLFYRFPNSIQILLSIVYSLFLLVSAGIIALGCGIALQMRDKNFLSLFLLTIGSVVAGTFVNMCIAYGRMNIPLIPFLLIAIGLGLEIILNSSKKFTDK